ncbi:M20/M25/M40 family metallo-hydrolase [Candidatus Entotheonella palauensis]|nr:M20/M25/M40 family metallo-hydrolase [Candidatus Entotheonella palauensis]
MDETKRQLLEWIDEDRDRLITFLSHFVQAKSPNPPGDTREAAAHITGFLDDADLPYRVIDPMPEFPNIVASFEGAAPGKHLVLNGHIDCFPAAEHETWTHGGPWSGAIADGKIWGRGAADMKCGTTASIFTFAYLYRIRDQLNGKLTLTAVSDEETFGPWGARYLMEHHPEVHGDCCLNGEPSSPLSIRCGEKGPLWLKFTVRTAGAHGAYTHVSESASKIGAKLVLDLERLSSLDIPPPGNVGEVLAKARETIDRAQGSGASEALQRITVNIGVLQAGLKVNMIPSECVIEADLRLPVGVEKAKVLAAVDDIVSAYPQVTYEEINYSAPSWCDPQHEMVGLLQANAEALGRTEPQAICSLGGTDTRLWRYIGVPAYVYGPFPAGMGAGDEHVPIEDFLHIVRTHVLSAYDYLTSP